MVEGTRPLFIDTGAFYARFDANAQRHGRAEAVFEAIGDGTLPYRPLYTSTYVLDELATLVLSHRDHAAAVTALERVRDSSVTIVHPDERDFAHTHRQFVQYDGQSISFTDHMTGWLADERDVDRVFTFDTDHFRTLGFTPVPDDTGEDISAP
ncbi:type II toxin-antitoxin system VapC family toxin [Halobium palmae]|uniref:Ribonuclease VapC n=1 Tax=Halobium palmae TaxID=1776492 RepID=A0ABD5S0M2_9EURY